MTEKEFYTVADVAAKIGLGKATVWRWVRTGEIPGFKIGRQYLIPRQAFEEWTAAKVAEAEAQAVAVQRKKIEKEEHAARAKAEYMRKIASR